MTPMSLKLFKPTSDTQVDWFSVILKIIIGIYAIIMLLFLPLGQKSDSFYMIASGEWMLDNRALELYNVAAPVTIPVIGQNWLLCIYYALMWRLGEILSIGYGALYIQHVILMCCSVYVIRRLSKWYVKDSIYIADVMTILFLLCLPYLTAIRFAYVSATFVFLTFVLMQGWIDNRFKHFATPFIIVFFMAIVHMNCSSALSLVIPLAVLFVAIRNMFDKTTRKSSIGLIGFTLVLPICMGLCCPYGFEAVSVVFGANRINESLSGTPFSVNEIRSVFENPVYVVVQYMILGILIIWFFVYVRKLSWPFNLPWFIRLTWFDFCDLSLIIVAEIAVAVAARNVIYLVVFAMWNILQIWTSFEKILAESVDDNQFVSGMVYWFKYRNFVVAYVFFAFTALSLLMLLFDCYFMLLMPTTFDNDNIPIATEQYPLAETSISFIFLGIVKSY